MFEKFPDAKRFHVGAAIEDDTSHATLPVAIDGGEVVRTVRLLFPVVNNVQRREMLNSQRRLQQHLEQMCVERRQRIITEVTVAGAVCQARIAAMQAMNAANAHNGSAPAYPSDYFFQEANKLEVLAERLEHLLR